MPGSTYIEFDDVEVPVENLLGQENRGFEIIMSSKSLRRPSSAQWPRFRTRCRTLTQLHRLQPRATLAGGHKPSTGTGLYRGRIQLRAKEGDFWEAAALQPDHTKQVQRERAAGGSIAGIDGTTGLRA